MPAQSMAAHLSSVSPIKLNLECHPASTTRSEVTTHTSFFTAMSHPSGSKSTLSTSPWAEHQPSTDASLACLSCFRFLRLRTPDKTSWILSSSWVPFHPKSKRSASSVPDNSNSDFFSVCSESRTTKHPDEPRTYPSQRQHSDKPALDDNDYIPRPLSKSEPTLPDQSLISYLEALDIAKKLAGKWVTILERSQSLDDQYKVIGLGALKRMVMNRLSVPLTLFLEEEDSILHCHIHTPVGLRHMRSQLKGEIIQDEDPDAGVWEVRTQVVDCTIPWLEPRLNSVRALQNIRINSKIGISIATQCTVEDPQEGDLMFLNFTMRPYNSDKQLSADRVLRRSTEIAT